MPFHYISLGAFLTVAEDLRFTLDIVGTRVGKQAEPVTFNRTTGYIPLQKLNTSSRSQTDSCTLATKLKMPFRLPLLHPNAPTASLISNHSVHPPVQSQEARFSHF